jgi:hypothetical protein
MRYHHVAFLSLLLVGCYVPGRGFVESEFELVLKDRLPRFFHAPENAQASEYSARVTAVRQAIPNESLYATVQAALYLIRHVRSNGTP